VARSWQTPGAVLASFPCDIENLNGCFSASSGRNAFSLWLALIAQLKFLLSCHEIALAVTKCPSRQRSRTVPINRKIR
jgi:hypothetical protein